MKCGDVVRLRSGSPNLTIVWFEGATPWVVVGWFDGATYEEKRIERAALEVVSQ